MVSCNAIKTFLESASRVSIGRCLPWLNCFLFASALLFGAGALIHFITRPPELSTVSVAVHSHGLPKVFFDQGELAYEQLGDGILSLKRAAPTMQLPDLRTQLIYYGKNGRPDAETEKPLLHFSLSNKDETMTPPDEKLYLIYEGSGSSSRYRFSPKNEKTSLWIEAKPGDNDVEISVAMESEGGERIVEPEAHAQFKLQEKEMNRHTGSNHWDMPGGVRADSTLLVRQKAKWSGGDRFLERHGGNDYAYSIGKQRVDFGEGNEIYSVFVALGDCLVWKDNRWHATPPGKETVGHPLAVVKKLDDRLLNFELWDGEGKGKITLGLLKSSEPWPAQHQNALQGAFKFLGARTLKQSVFEINRERVILSPSDWLLQTSHGWKKLVSSADIDAYVLRKTTGVLFVFEGVSRKDDKQMMTGWLYSPSRHEGQKVELVLNAAEGGKTSPANKGKQEKERVDNAEENGRKKPNREPPKPPTAVVK